ncbi:MAG: ExbD/TolR family protein, partial [Pirellulales bacterium]
MLKPKDLPKGEKVELQMTAMIDVVFQLLIFFILT